LTYFLAPAVKIFLTLCIIVLITGCTQTKYAGLNENTERAPTPALNFQLADAFYKDPPDCIVIMPLKNIPSEVKSALRKALYVKVLRVISGTERSRMARHWAIDLTHLGDRKTFSRLSKCRFALEAKGWNNSETHAVIWSQKSVGIKATLRRISDGLVVWQGRHVVERSGGGLPLSPLSIAVQAFSASRFAMDNDKSFSMADDLARHLLKTFPDSRWLLRRNLTGY
jgi:hypothetical protein